MDSAFRKFCYVKIDSQFKILQLGTIQTHSHQNKYTHTHTYTHTYPHTHTNTYTNKYALAANDKNIPKINILMNIYCGAIPV